MPLEGVWAARNLGAGEHWGREIERALDDLGGRTGRVRERIQGTNRNVAASSEDLANAIQKTYDLAVQIEGAIIDTPRYFIVSGTASGFGFGNSWQTVIRRRVNAVEGFTVGEVSAIGTLYTEQPVTPLSSFDWPFPPGTVSSEYGPRPPLPFHNGIDFAVPAGTPIPSASAGVVIINSYFDDYGWYVRVDVSEATGVEGSWLGYAHMQSQSPLPVGTTVTRGQTLGPVGNTGFSFGAHLHWETAPGGQRIDPRIFMDIFGGETSSTVLEVQSRILINEASSPAFKPYAEVGIGPKQQNFPIFGRTVTDLGRNDLLDVALQIRAVGGNIPRDANNRATLTLEGGFR